MRRVIYTKLQVTLLKWQVPLSPTEFIKLYYYSFTGQKTLQLFRILPTNENKNTTT